MGTCGTNKAVITNSVMAPKQSKENEDKNKEENDLIFENKFHMNCNLISFFKKI